MEALIDLIVNNLLMFQNQHGFDLGKQNQVLIFFTKLLKENEFSTDN